MTMQQRSARSPGAYPSATFQHITVLDGSGGMADAPSDGHAYGRLNAAWTQVLPITGGALTGALTVGVGANNAFSIVPGAVGSNAIAFNQSGSGGINVAPVVTFGVGSGGAGNGVLVQNTAQARTFSTSGNTWAIATAITPLWNSLGTYSGTLTTNSQADLHRMAVTADSMDGRLGQDGAIKGANMQWNISNTARGARWGFGCSMNVASGLANPMGLVPLRGAITATGNMGGSFLQPLATQITLTGTASNVGNTLSEMDYGALAGASGIGIKGALQITLIRSDAVAGAIDAATFYTNSNLSGVSPGMGAIIALGNTGQGFPINPTTGSIVTILPQTADQGTGRSGPFINQSGFAGIDLALMNTSLASGYSFRGGGFAVDGVGQVTAAGGLVAGVSGTAYTLDVPNTQRVQSVAVAVAGAPAVNPGSSRQSYYPGDIVFGTGTPTPGQYQVTSTQVLSAAITAGGSGGTNGTQTVTGTTGTGTRFQASVTVAGGAITAIGSITVPGNYTAAPTNLNAEPVTGAGLTGATLAIGMGALAVSVLVPGVFAVNPGAGGIAPVAGSGAGLTLTPTTAAVNTLSLVPTGGRLVLPLLTNAANDAAAASAGVVVGQLYRNGSAVQQRVA
jgi:hypothetical protein